jgi:hypothetical protein
MRTLQELRAFCEGVLAATATDDIPSTDTWIVWDDYDINFAGSDYSGHAKNEDNLHVDVYKAGWTDSIGEPVYSFTI